MGKDSFVWNCFIKQTGGDYAKCKFCKVDYKTSHNTSNLIDHMKRKHFSEYQQQTGTTDDETPPKKKRNITLPDMLTRTQYYTKDSEEKKKLDSLLVKFVSNSMMSFNILQHEDFRNFVAALNKKYPVPSNDQFRESLLPEFYKSIQKSLIDILNTVDYVAITTDLWTSPANVAIITVTTHFLYKDELKSAVLDTIQIEAPHTSENVAKKINEITDNWKIRHKIISITSDNGSNVVKAADILKIRHLPCFAHTMNLVVMDSLKSEKIKPVIDKLKKIVTHFRCSSSAKENLDKMQKLIYEGKVLQLIQDCPTRWNSTYAMIERALAISEALILAISMCNLKKLSSDEIEILQDLIALLAPFEKATKDISGQEFVTVSVVIPLIHGIYSKLLATEPAIKTDAGRTVFNNLKQSIQKRLFAYESRTVTVLSTVLDPRFKLLAFRTQEQMENAKILLLDALASERNLEKEVARNPPDTSEDPPESCPSTSHDLYSFLNTRRCAETSGTTTSSRSDAIVLANQYLKASTFPITYKDIFTFWKNHESPTLKKLACKNLVIPGSSVPSERVFSAAGLIISDKRSQLKPEKFNMLIFLKQNSWLY